MSVAQGKVKSLVVLSGGLDSAVALAISELAPGSVAMAVDYGQNNKIELECAQYLAAHYKIPLLIEDISSHGKLLNKGMTKPGENVNSQFGPGGELPSSYVPARNLVILSLALSLAESMEIGKVVVGFINGQWTGDATTLFVSTLNEVAAIACDKFMPTVYAPLLQLSKQGVVRLGVQLEVPLNETWSCHNAPFIPDRIPWVEYKFKGLACGVCGACKSRYWAFKENGFEDPLSYFRTPEKPE